MNKLARGITYCCCLLLVLTACHRKSLTSSSGGNTDTTNYALLSFHPKVLAFEYLHVKSKVHYTSDKNDYKFTVNTRIRRDSIIWMSITGGPGVEVVRALIRKDSIFVMDKMNNQLYRYGFDYIRQTLNVDADYSMIEAMIAGNLPVAPLNRDSLSMEAKDGKRLLYQERGQYQISNYIDTTQMRLQQLFIEQAGTKNNMALEYKDFVAIDSIPCANSCEVKTSLIQNGAKKETHIEIQHTKIDISQKDLSFPFNIPNRYEENNK